MEEINLPDFLKKYHTGSDIEGQAHLDVLAQQYERERQQFMQEVYPQKAALQRDWNATTGQQQNIAPEEMLADLKQKYDERAKTIAVEYGYQEQEPQSEQTEREIFLQKLQAQHERQKPQRQNENNETQSAQNDDKPQEPQTERERFLSKLETMREQKEQITHRPRH